MANLSDEAMRRAIRSFLLSSAFGQSNYGELRLLVTDPSGLSVQTTVEIVSQGNQYSSTLATDEHGALIVKHLPYGVYPVEIHASGFAGISEPVDIASSDTDRENDPACDSVGITIGYG